jgi:two-component system cell cycle response regulator
LEVSTAFGRLEGRRGGSDTDHERPTANSRRTPGPLERSTRTATILKLLWLASFVVLGLYVVHALGGFRSQAIVPDDELLYPLGYVLAAAICFTRVATIPRERLIWTFFGAGMLCSGAGWVYGYLLLQHDPTASSFSIAEGFSLTFYVASFFALMLMLRGRLRRFSTSLWLDAVIGVLALAAVSAALLVEPIVKATGGDTQAVAISLAYPLADVLTLALVIGMLALSGWRLERRWVMVGFAWTFQVAADTVYVHQAATGAYVPGTLLDSVWVVVDLLIAWAAWQRSDPPPLRFEGWPVLGVPLAFTLVAIGVLIYGNFEPLNPAAITLAILALLASLIGTVSAYFEQRELEALAKRDALTGLYNYREFHRRVDEQLGAAQVEGNGFAIVLMDVDGFKDVNDLRGHAEGDRVLREVARAIGAGKRGPDLAARIGGDEFAILMPAAEAEGAEALGRRISEQVEKLGEGIGMSFGVAGWPIDGPSKEMLLLRADIAMYSAKSGLEGDARVARVAEDGIRGGDDDAAAVRRMRRGDTRDGDRELEKAQLRAYAEAVRQSYAHGLERTQQLKQNYLATVLTLASAVEAKDEYTGGHINRVHHLGLLLARQIVPREADDSQMAYGFLLHDIGKLTVPDAILNKTSALTDDEWELMRRHPEAGVRILAPIPFLGRAIDVVRHHHERWDGRGYPGGLAGAQIPLWARIFAVVDAVDAMTSDRPYRAALPLEVAHEELDKGSGTQFDPACVAAFIRLDRMRVESLIQQSSSASALTTAKEEAATAVAVANQATAPAE